MSNLQCSVVSVSYKGGLIGMVADNKKILETKIQEHNDNGFRLRQVLPPKANLIDLIVQLVFLTVTLLIYAPLKGETLIFERASSD